jgi:hypothetical protein
MLLWEERLPNKQPLLVAFPPGKNGDYPNIHLVPFPIYFPFSKAKPTQEKAPFVRK